MSVVGRAYVNVRGVTREFEGDVERGVNGALDRVASNSRVQGQQIGDELGEGIKKSPISKKIEEAVRSSDMDRAGSDIGQAIGDSLLADGAIKKALAKAFDAAMPEINETGKKAEESMLGGIGRGLTRTLASPALWIGVAVPPAITQGFTLLSTTAAAATEVVGTLGPVIATAGVTGAAAMGTLLTAVGGVTLAFKLQKDEVLALGQQLAPVADDFRDIADEVAGRLFPVLAESGNRINNAIGDELQTGLVATADSVGNLTTKFARLTEQPFFQDNLADIMESNAKSLDRFGSVGTNVASILSDVGDAAVPAVDRVVKSIKRISDELADSARIGNTNGGLNDFFDRAVDTTMQWADIIGDLSAGLFDVFSAGTGGTLLDSLAGVTEQFRDWADSAQGQGSIQEWFDQARPVMSAVADTIGALGSVIGQVSGNTESLIGTLEALTTGIPAVGGIITTLSDEFQTLLGGVIPLIGALATDLTPGIEGAAGALGDNLLPALENVAGPLGDVLSAALDITENIAPLAQVVGSVLAPALDVAAYALTGIDEALDHLPGPVSTAILSIAGLRIAFGLLAGSAKFGPVVGTWTANMAAIRAQNGLTAASMAGVKSAAAGAVGVMGGGLGLALAGAAIAYGVFASKSAEAKGRTDAFTDTLDEQTAALTDNTRELVKKRLEEEGAYESAQTLGISLEDVTDAALGNADALGRIKDRYAELNEGDIDTKQFDAMSNLGAAFADVTEEVDSAVESKKRLLEADGKVADQSGTTAKAVRNVADGFGEAEFNTARYIRQVELLDGGAAAATATLRRMRTVTLSVNDAAIKGIEAQSAFEAAIDDARKKMKDTNDTLKLGSEDGRENVGVLLGIAKAAGEVTGSAEKQQKALKRARDEVLELAKSKTKDDDAAKKLTDRIFRLTESYDKVPKDVKTKVDSPTMEQQIENAKELKKRLDDINNRTYTYTIVEGTTVGSPYSPGAAPPPSSPGSRPGSGAGGGSGDSEDRPGGRGVDPRRAGGVNFNGDITVNAENYDDMMRKLGRKSRSAALGGFGRGVGENG